LVTPSEVLDYLYVGQLLLLILFFTLLAAADETLLDLRGDVLVLILSFKAHLKVGESFVQINVLELASIQVAEPAVIHWR